MAKEFINSSIFRYLSIGFASIIFLFLSYERLTFYVRFDLNFILVLLVLPFVIQRESSEKSVRYGITAIVFLCLYALFNLSSFYFLAFICSLFFLYESLFGKLNILPLFLVIIISPVVIFISEILGFEIRLNLTTFAVKCLNLLNEDYKSTGNVIIIKNKEFHVDSVCMGLKMVIASFYTALIIISYYQKRYKTKPKILNVIITLFITYILVILSNFFRILLITVLAIDTETFAHELVGILCFIVYVILPLLFIIKKTSISKQEKTINEVYTGINNKSFYIIIVIITVLMLYFKLYPETKSNEAGLIIKDTELNTGKYRFSIEELNVIKLSSKDLLIYIKPAVSFYSAEHSPIICWKGCGYKIEKEQVLSLNGNDVFFSELRFKKEILYSCWWYDSGNDKTISQFRWRSESLIKNKKYHLINIVSYKKAIVIEETKKILKRNLF
ncbi:MAG: exosortase N [Bacteroidales bacterium]